MTASPALIDPLDVGRNGKPNDFLLAPAGRARAVADATSPVFDILVDALEAAWLGVVAAEPRTNRLGHDPARRLYLFRQRSAVFGFPDLIAVRFLEAAPGRSTLAVYSRARFGYADFGVNRRRVEAWVGKLEARLGR